MVTKTRKSDTNISGAVPLLRVCRLIVGFLIAGHIYKDLMRSMKVDVRGSLPYTPGHLFL